MTQSAANHSPRSSSLLNRELTGNFGVFGPKRLLARSKSAGSTKAFPANSLRNGTGNFNHRTGNPFGGTGNFQGGAGNLLKPRFCSRGRLSRRRESAAQAAGTPRSTYSRSLSTLPSTSLVEGTIDKQPADFASRELPLGMMPQFTNFVASERDLTRGDFVSIWRCCGFLVRFHTQVSAKSCRTAESGESSPVLNVITLRGSG